MPVPSFSPGQRLTAADLNAVVDLASAGVPRSPAPALPRPAVRGSQLPETPLARGLDGRLATRPQFASAVGNLAVIPAGVSARHDAARVESSSGVLILEREEKIVYEVIRTDAFGRPLSVDLQADPVSPVFWNGETEGVLCRQVGAVEKNPFAEPSSVGINSHFWREFNDSEIPVIPIPASTSGVSLLESPVGASIPVCTLAAGSNVTISKSDGVVTISASGGGGGEVDIPLAYYLPDLGVRVSGLVYGIEEVAGLSHPVISQGMIKVRAASDSDIPLADYNPSTGSSVSGLVYAAETTTAVGTPYFSAGVLRLPSGCALSGFLNKYGGKVHFADVGSGNNKIELASFLDDGGTLHTLTLSRTSDNFLQFLFV